MSTLSIVGTPIGNLEDITLRALKVLGSVDCILCEDTRVTKKLLARHNISTKTLSYHTHSTLSRVEEIISMLREGKNLALVSDAGTPGVSDPGIQLVSIVREQMKDELVNGTLKIESIPGPSALTSALSIAGIPAASFTFLGFMPHKKGRKTLFKEMLASERTYVFYESPHRIEKTLEQISHISDLESTKGEGVVQKRITICRELTKIFEEVVSGTVSEVAEYFKKNQDKVRGEFVVLVS